MSRITTTIMAASCKVVCCEEERESDKAILVRFSNGFTDNAERLDFAIFKNTDENNPRKKIRRIVVAESERLSYVGQNFGEDLMKCNNLCRYYVGVLNKETMEMEMHSAQLFNMQPVIPGEGTQDAMSQDATVSYREKVDSLIEAFGTNKQKRALSSRRLNQVGSDALHHAVAEAASSVIDNKGLEALQQEVAETESQGSLSLHLPPCNPDADKQENVYPFEELLSSVEFAALEASGQKMAALSQEELQKLKNQRGNLCVVKHLENMPSADDSREKTARCAFYLSLLIKLSHQKIVTRKFWTEEGCPRVIQNKMLRTFTVETYNNARVQSTVSTSMRTKIAAHSLALLLHLGDMTVDLSLLHRDLEITEPRMLEIAKSMGLTLSKPARGKGDDTELQDEHRYASLILPLIKHDKFVERRKRKKMH